MVYNPLPTYRTEVSTCYPLLVVVIFVPHKTPPMVRVDVHYAYGASSGVAGRPSPLTPNRRSATERARAEDVARRSQMAMIAKSRLRSRHDGTWQHHTISIPVWELLNELPVRVREEVEIIRRCCLPFWTGTYYDSSCDPDNSNLRRHQLFSQDHVESLDTEIRQWLPRYLCPAFPLSIRCDGGVQLGDSMLRHVKNCGGFKSHFPDEYKELFPRPSDPRPPLDEKCRFLKMTDGQLTFLKARLSEMANAGEHRLADASAEMVQAILYSWRPLVRLGVEDVLPSEFPPIQMPLYFSPADHDIAKAGYDVSLGHHVNVKRASFGVAFVEEEIQDEPRLVYPELYLPPHLLNPTSDPAYFAAAVAVHKPRSEEKEISPLVHVPFPSYPAEIPLSAALMAEYDPAIFSPGDGNSHVRGFTQPRESIA